MALYSNQSGKLNEIKDKLFKLEKVIGALAIFGFVG